MTTKKVLSSKKSITDLLKVPDEQKPELINGQIVKEAHPLPRHGLFQMRLGSLLFPFDGTSGRGGGGSGPGGWHVLTEACVRYDSANAFRHDIAGWKIKRTPIFSNQEYTPIRPDWVCEILSPTNAKQDQIFKFNILQKFKNPFFWLVDATNKTVTMYKLKGKQYVLQGMVGDQSKGRFEPFEKLEINFSILFR